MPRFAPHFSARSIYIAISDPFPKVFSKKDFTNVPQKTIIYLSDFYGAVLRNPTARTEKI
jgi:hypothetical protein